MILFVFLWGCARWRLLNGFLRSEVVDLRVVLMGARGGVNLLAVDVLCCVSSFTCFCGLWHRGSECGGSCLGLCLARFFVNVLSRWSVV